MFVTSATQEAKVGSKAPSSEDYGSRSPGQKKEPLSEKSLKTK
jgi:hypothetical protein